MNEYMEIRRLIDTVLRWWWLLILSTVITVTAGYLLSQRQPKVYQATGVVMVGRFIQSTDLNRDDIQVNEVLAQNYADLALRQPILNAVVEALELEETWRQLGSNVRVDLVANTNLLEITVKNNSPEEAGVIVDEISHQLILLSLSGLQSQGSQDAEQSVRQQLDNLQSMIETGQERYIVLQSGLSSGNIPDPFNEKLNELNTLGLLISDWQKTQNELFLFLDNNSRSPNRLSVVQPAQVNPKPVSPNVALTTLLSGGLGMILALGLIFVLELGDKTIKSIEEVVKDFGVNPLGVVVETESENVYGKLLFGKDPFSHESESYRLLRSNIELTADRPIKSLLVTSPGNGEGKNITVANLGIVMAQAGLKTIIVDADFRNPTLDKIFHVNPSGGLAELLASPVTDPKDYLKNTRQSDLQLLTSGDLFSFQVKPMTIPAVTELMSNLSKLEADILIFTSPPALGFADCLTLASQMDGVVLVMEAGQTIKNGVRDAVSNLHLAKANLLGVVLNQVSSKTKTRFWQNLFKRKEPIITDAITARTETRDLGRTKDQGDKALGLLGYDEMFRSLLMASENVEQIELKIGHAIIKVTPQKNKPENDSETMAIHDELTTTSEITLQSETRDPEQTKLINKPENGSETVVIPERFTTTSEITPDAEEARDPVEAKEVRDKALGILGYTRLFQISELVAMDVEHVEFQKEGVAIKVPQPKNKSKNGFEERVISYEADPITCPARALKHWLEVANISKGPVFRQIRKGGVVLNRRLSSGTIEKLIKGNSQDLEVSEDETSQKTMELNGKGSNGHVKGGKSNGHVNGKMTPPIGIRPNPRTRS